jgi:hypothetical protein
MIQQGDMQREGRYRPVTSCRYRKREEERVAAPNGNKLARAAILNAMQIRI